jgi:hypothetical protein
VHVPSSQIGIRCLASRKIVISAWCVVNVRDADYCCALVSALPLCNMPAEIEIPENANA